MKEVVAACNTSQQRSYNLHSIAATKVINYAELVHIPPLHLLDAFIARVWLIKRHVKRSHKRLPKAASVAATSSGTFYSPHSFVQVDTILTYQQLYTFDMVSVLRWRNDDPSITLDTALVITQRGISSIYSAEHRNDLFSPSKAPVLIQPPFMSQNTFA